MKTLILYLVFFASMAMHSVSFSQGNLLLQETFDQDVSGWSNTGQPGGNVSWSNSIGLPPGSLRVSTEDSEPTGTGYRASKGCFSANSGDLFTIELDSRGEFGEGFGTCNVVVAEYADPNCVGDPQLFGNVPLSPDGQWIHEERAIQISNPNAQSVRVDLVLTISSNAPNGASCHFDNLLFFEGTQLDGTPVPSGGHILALLLALGIGMIAAIRFTVPRVQDH